MMEGCERCIYRGVCNKTGNEMTYCLVRILALEARGRLE